MIIFVSMQQDELYQYIGERRLEKIRRVVSNRQGNFTLILENVHDAHNLGAVLRTAESAGISEIYALYTVESSEKIRIISGHKSSSGAKKWIDIHIYEDIDACYSAVRKKYKYIYASALSDSSYSLYDLDLSTPVALVFGNEHRGVSEESIRRSDGVFTIPQFGFTQSLNISVACAISVYEGVRQRIAKGLYPAGINIQGTFKQNLLETYIKKSHPKIFGKKD